MRKKELSILFESYCNLEVIVLVKVMVHAFNSLRVLLQQGAKLALSSSGEIRTPEYLSLSGNLRLPRLGRADCHVVPRGGLGIVLMPDMGAPVGFPDS